MTASRRPYKGFQISQKRRVQAHHWRSTGPGPSDSIVRQWPRAGQLLDPRKNATPTHPCRALDRRNTTTAKRPRFRCGPESLTALIQDSAQTLELRPKGLYRPGVNRCRDHLGAGTTLDRYRPTFDHCSRSTFHYINFCSDPYSVVVVSERDGPGALLGRRSERARPARSVTRLSEWTSVTRQERYWDDRVTVLATCGALQGN